MKNLIVVRASDNSFHRNWLEAPGVKPNFDLFVSYYGNEVGKYKGDGILYEEQKGGKWDTISNLLKYRSSFFSDYDAVGFWDDDISTDAGTVNGFFDVFHEYSLDLAQPALTASSPHFWPHTLRCPGMRLRFCNFVECMIPTFSRRALKTCAPTFDGCGVAKSGTGWGLDVVWSYLLFPPDSRMAVVDRWPVTHTRTVGKGDMVQRYTEIACDPTAEYQRVMRKFSMPQSYANNIRNFEVVTRGIILENEDIF
jgi:hypothetical protein